MTAPSSYRQLYNQLGLTKVSQGSGNKYAWLATLLLALDTYDTSPQVSGLSAAQDVRAKLAPFVDGTFLQSDIDGILGPALQPHTVGPDRATVARQESEDMGVNY